MRVPIAYALHHPERVDVPVPRARPRRGRPRSTFEPPDLDAFPCLRLAREAAEAGGTAPCVLNAANEVAVHAFLAGRLDFIGIPAVIESTLEQLPAARVHSFDTLYARRRRGARGSRRAVGGARMSWVLAFLGFAALIILHELGHFTAAKAVGMRVERFSLFFPPLLARVRRGETEYADRGDPARRLREDHRHEPGGGDPAGGRPSRLLPPAGLEARRRDRAPARPSTSCSRS